MSLNLNTQTFAGITFVAALGLLGFSLYQMSLPYWSPANEASTTEADIAKNNVKTIGTGNKSPEINLIEKLSRWHLFGLVTTKKTIAQPKAVVEKRPQTKLNLTIKGIINEDNASNGWAIIANASGKESHFKVGDKIFNLANLDEIHTDYIVLSRNGRQEELRINRKPVTFEKVPDNRAAKSRKKQPAANTENKLLDAFRNGLFDQHLAVLDYEEAYNDTNDQFLGFQLTTTAPQGEHMLRSFGLAPGDIVTHVNGMLLTLETDEETIVENIGKHKPTRLKVIRNGKRLTISIPVPM